MTAVRSRPKKTETFHFAATCGAGLEDLVRDEIIAFGGAEVLTSPGAVRWQASTLESAYRACLWSRFASRILIQIAEFTAADPERLYAEAVKIDWTNHFTIKNTFAVSCTLVNSVLGHNQYAALKVKDAIADGFRNRTGRRPDVDPQEPDIRINLHVEGTAAVLSLDLSGESLHRRGYREDGGEAPLKESLAAAIVHLAGVRPGMDADSCLLDPMCGSGTLLIESALILGDSAPGLLRERFGFMAWQGHNPKLWEKLTAEALEREDELADSDWPHLIGYDADPKAVAAARKNIANAGLTDRITIKQRQLAQLQPPTEQGLLFTNPPYGERLSEKEAAKYLYRCLGRIFREHFAGWRLGFFTANPDLADMLGLSWQERHRLYNGPLKCRLLTATSPGGSGPEPHVWTLGETNPDLPAQDFSNRLRKNCQSLFPWAKENGITCFRVYDADIPEFNVAVDLYEQWVHVQEYAAPASVAADKAEERFNQALQAIRHLLNVPHSQIFIKSRERQRGKEQYQKEGEIGKLHEVHEGGCRFLVNFTDYLDTGLFLDHRKTRAMLASLAQGKAFLNLFAYTGSATVYAATGGAVSSKSVDLSEKYLLRAQANLSLNGYGGSLHQFVEDDCMGWLRACRERYGLIFVDPPTFANSRHKNLVFDVQKDHSELLRLAMQRLTKDGVLIFSTNFRKFKFDATLAEEFAVREITASTVPRDFADSRPHRCWQFSHARGEERTGAAE
jgi:23S rRNA (guanine2445-N2)-methyltransferase / 23S rRNA (guanine2069-N7)-methyltransferase